MNLPKHKTDKVKIVFFAAETIMPGRGRTED